MTLLQCSIVDERVAVLEANSIFLGFVHATASKTLKVEEMLFSSTTVSKISNSTEFQKHFLILGWLEEINLKTEMENFKLSSNSSSNGLSDEW